MRWRLIRCAVCVGLVAFAVQAWAQVPAGGGNPVLGAPGTPGTAGARVRPAGTPPAQPPGRNAGGRPFHNEAERAARWKVVAMPYSRAGLTAAEQQMIAKLADALHWMDQVYLQQSDLGGYWMYHTTQNPDLYRLFSINGSRWDLVDKNTEFIGEEPLVPGHELYPFGTTPATIEKYVAAHPEQKDAIYNPWTVVRSAPLDLNPALSQPVMSVAEKLYTYPYHEAYAEWVKPMAADLRAAAKLSPDAAFAHYLNLRADALLTDDYYASDVAWLDLKAPKVDLIFAPYENYIDGVLGVKTSYGGSILIRNEAESRKLKMYEDHEAAMQAALPIDDADKPSKAGFATPMEVADAPLRAGDLRYGYQAVADNLPNDAKIHAEKGSKKIFFKNFMDARVNNVILPVAEKVMTAEDAKLVSGQGCLTGAILHEVSHGLGPVYAHVGGKQMTINEAIGASYTGLEEAKADVTGIFLAKWLVDQKLLPESELNVVYASYVAGIFRTLRFGTGEAHGRAEMMEFNYLLEKGALKKGDDGKYAIDFAAMPDAIAGLDTKLLTLEAEGDRAGSEAWFAKYDVMSRELTSALDAAKEIPVDITPEFELARGVRP